MHRSILAIASVTILFAALPAAAQFQKPEDAIKYRQSAMTLMASHFGRVAAMAQGKVPFDAKAATANAALANTIAALPFSAFGPGTDKGRPTRAKAEVWTQGDKFKAASEEMQAAMAKLDAAAKTGDLEQIKGTVGAVGKSCKGCHDDFQNEKYSAN